MCGGGKEDVRVCVGREKEGEGGRKGGEEGRRGGEGGIG